MTHTIKIKIYYEDTDAGGVVYYANYLRYLERARTEFLLDRGIDILEYQEQGYFFVVVHVDISYKRPARLGDNLEVKTEVTEIKNATIIVKNQVLKDDTLLVEAYVTIACIDKEGKPQRLPDSFKGLH
ncbi:MAG: tol-pal system-associated acyl-CoA thioesterase [Nitrospirota bacterium]|nr:tol-pal system-associated acyl-CoA thioesterase [Nitrospirota bacterium]